MIKLQKLSLLALTLVVVSCNEKISPELKDSNFSNPGGGSSPSTTNFSFELINKAEETLNYKLHKTGSGNANTACKIASTNAMTHSNFSYPWPVTTTNPEQDITCFLEAEELALYAEGLAFEIKASPNTCDFVSYTPFSYFNRMPGDSSGTYTKISCANDDTTAAHVNLALGDPVIQHSAGMAGCDDYLSKSTRLTTATRQVFKVDEEENITKEADLCRFNYTDGDKESCDIGKIVISEYVVTFDKAAAVAAADILSESQAVANGAFDTYRDGVDTDGAGPDDNTAAVSAIELAAIKTMPAYKTAYDAAYIINYADASNDIKYTKVNLQPSTLINCGGKVANCVKGPIKEHSEIARYTRGSLIGKTTKAQSYSNQYTYPSLLPERAGTFIYANYRRNFANSDIPYTLPSLDVTAYANFFEDATIFDPLTLERYSRNRDQEGEINIGVTNPAIYIESSKFTAKPLAAEAFLGLEQYAVSPFYTFECLDTAREPKARIRLMVRDWDRIFPTENLNGTANADLELLSDIYKTTMNDLARQDISGTQFGGDFGDYDDWNDYYDWDDLIEIDNNVMSNTYIPVDGYFKANNFPNEYKLD